MPIFVSKSNVVGPSGHSRNIFMKSGSGITTQHEVKHNEQSLSAVANPSSALILGPAIAHAKSAYSSLGTSISYGGSLEHGLKKLNFDIKKKVKNIKLRI